MDRSLADVCTAWRRREQHIKSVLSLALWDGSARKGSLAVTLLRVLLLGLTPDQWVSG